MKTKCERSKSSDGTVAFEGNLLVTKEVFSGLEQAVRTSVQQAVEDAFKQPSLATHREQFGESPTATRRGLELSDEERSKVLAALSGREIGPARKPGQGMIDARTLAQFLDVSHRLLYRLIAEDALPSPVVVGTRAKRWLIEEIMAWVFTGCMNGEKWRRNRKMAMREYRSMIEPSKR